MVSNGIISIHRFALYVVWQVFACHCRHVHSATNLACLSLHRAVGAVGLSEILKEQQQQRYLLETLKEQQQQQRYLLETLKEQQQQQHTEQQQQHTEQQQLLTEQQQLLTEQQQQRYLLETLKEQQQQQHTEQQQLLTEQQQNYQGLMLDLFHPTSSIASSKELKRYRDGALMFYYGSSSYAEYTCMVTGMECSAGELVAGHIYRQQWPKSCLVSNLLPTSTGQCSCVQEKLARFLTGAFWHLSNTGASFSGASCIPCRWLCFWHHSPV